MKKNFDLNKRLGKAKFVSKPQDTNTTNLSGSIVPDSVPTSNNDTEIILKRIEATQTDITSSYADWVKIGYALAHEYGEVGRSYFKRVSQFYPKYDQTECNKQYNSCLKTTDIKTNIGSFFHCAKEAGIDIHCEDSIPEIVDTETTTEPIISEEPVIEPIVENQESGPLIYNTPCLPTEVYDNLPDFLKSSCDLFKDGIEKDIFLTSAVGVLSGCFPKVEGFYFRKPLSPQLYLFIVGPSAAGKGSMDWSKYLALTIHDQLVLQSYNERTAYELELNNYENLPRALKQSAEKPILPKRRMFFIPGNSSNAALTQALAENDNRGLIFETEADTMVNTAKQDWGDASDLYRKAFHHETVSLYRKKENEYIEIKKPHVAIVISGTPLQLTRLLPSAENGLYSRYMYYAFEDNGGFNNPFESRSQVDYIAYFKQKGELISEYYNHLQNRTQSIEFKLTDDQAGRFTSYFDGMLHKSRVLVGHDFDASVKRMGIIHFRIAMILSVLRMFQDGEQVDSLICTDQDYQTALTIVTTLEQHAVAVFQTLPNNELKGAKLNFYNKLPQQFDRQGYLKVAVELGIQPKTAEKYIGQFNGKLLHHEHNLYTKIVK